MINKLGNVTLWDKVVCLVAFGLAVSMWVQCYMSYVLSSLSPIKIWKIPGFLCVVLGMNSCGEVGEVRHCFFEISIPIIFHQNFIGLFQNILN